MKTLRHSILGLVLAAIGLLAVLSAVGALEGADKARDLFNSVPLVVFWVLLAALLVAGFVLLRRLLASPAGLAMHAGSLLVLAGAMWGSDRAHELRAAWLGSTKVPSGMIVIFKDEAEDRILDAGLRHEIGRLPFSLFLRDFWIDYYPAEQKQWALAVVAPSVDEQGNVTAQGEKQFPWAVGRQVQVPGTAVRLTVLQYIPAARPVFAAGAKAVLEIAPAAGQPVELPAVAGEEAKLADPPATVRIVRVFKNLRVVGTGPDREIVDAPGGENPALQVEVARPDAAPSGAYVLPQFPTPLQAEDGSTLLELRYRLPEPTGAVAESDATVPAMEVMLACDGRERREWLLPQEGEEVARLSLAPLVGGPAGHAGYLVAPTLFLLKPVGPILAYNSDVAVRDADHVAVRQTIQVNHPLHYGGYDFCQIDYDHQNGDCTVLSAVSDSGLPAVYLGLFLATAGAFWRFWGEPAWAYLRARGSHGD